MNIKDGSNGGRLISKQTIYASGGTRRRIQQQNSLCADLAITRLYSEIVIPQQINMTLPALTR